MQHVLPARSRLLSVLLLLLALFARPAMATHLLGGEITYRYLDSDGPFAAPNRYEITLTLYINCLPGVASPPTDAPLYIYDAGTGSRLVMTTTNYYNISGGNVDVLTSSPGYSTTGCIQPTNPPNCTITGPTQPYIRQVFSAIVNLPSNQAGYYVAYTLGNRNNDITNIASAGSAYLTLYTAIAPPSIPNRSPVFADIAIAIICANDTTFFLNNAIDPDGDRLTYSFGTPYSVATLPNSFTPPPATVSYNAGYSATAPFGTGTGRVNLLDQNTGVATFSTTLNGKYVVAVDVKEYRTIGGVERLLGTTRRDVQLVAATCPPVTKPKAVAPVVQGQQKNYTIAAGESITINMKATQADNHPLTLTVNSELLDGSGGYGATFNGSSGTSAPSGLTGIATATGATGSVSADFVFNSACSDARTAPYLINLSVKDEGCAGKTIYDVYQVTVVPPTGPTTITGNTSICGTGATTYTYTATGGTATKFAWTITGGTIVSGQNTNTVTVTWNTAGAGSLSVQGSSTTGCLANKVTLPVTVQTLPVLTATGSRNICPGSSTTITLSGAGTGAVYTVTGGPYTGSGNTFTLSPTATTTYTFTNTATTGTCANTLAVTVNVYPAVVANAGPAKTTVGGQPVQIGAAPVAGYSYSWSPATGLDNPNSANPTVKLTNYTGAPITQTYTLTTTNLQTNCTATASVVVTINVDTRLEIYNIVTTNTTLRNKALYIDNVESFPGASIEIYNRWGRKVFETTNYNNTSNNWGTDPSIAPGVYYYLFKQVNGSAVKGWVEVIR